MITLLIAAAAQAATPAALPSPGEIVAAAPASEWRAIAAEDLLVMELAGGRRVTIQLMPPPFSQPWIANIRTLAAARWWDGTSINRVQDNYVVQWGDATEKKLLPEGLIRATEREYTFSNALWAARPPLAVEFKDDPRGFSHFFAGFPIQTQRIPSSAESWPVHCYGMVGVGRGLPPDTGTGAELYTVIGHAPRHLDRNIALVGRVIDGIEHLSSLPRGAGALGFYEKAEQRVPIVSVRLGSALADPPRWQYLDTASASFARYAEARANRRDPFFIRPAGGADICNIPVPIRRAP